MKTYLDRDFKNDGEVFPTNNRTLLIDGDILLYKPCCIFNADDDIDRRLITSNIKVKINEILTASECHQYRFFLTTKENFRHWISDRYKINRADVERPVNLSWVKEWCVKHLNAEYITYLEADDLIAMNQTDETVVWSIDKDLKQVPGWHINDATLQLEKVSEIGKVEFGNDGKIKFFGYKGLMFQCLTGDSTDSIIGCGVRTKRRYKSGKHKGEEYTQRVGIGPKEAMQLLKGCPQTAQGYLHIVKRQYQKLYSEGAAMKMLEKEVNLLMMVTDYNRETFLAKRWTYDGRDEYLNITTGEVCGRVS